MAAKCSLVARRSAPGRPWRRGGREGRRRWWSGRSRPRLRPQIAYDQRPVAVLGAGAGRPTGAPSSAARFAYVSSGAARAHGKRFDVPGRVVCRQEISHLHGSRFRSSWPRPAILRHDRGLAARPRVRYTLERAGASLPFWAADSRRCPPTRAMPAHSRAMPARRAPGGNRYAGRAPRTNCSTALSTRPSSRSPRTMSPFIRVAMPCMVANRTIPDPLGVPGSSAPVRLPLRGSARAGPRTRGRPPRPGRRRPRGACRRTSAPAAPRRRWRSGRRPRRWRAGAPRTPSPAPSTAARSSAPSRANPASASASSSAWRSGKWRRGAPWLTPTLAGQLAQRERARRRARAGCARPAPSSAARRLPWW